MKQTKKMKQLLERMARIARMERGKLCRMGSRPHYNHQTWQEGRNVVRYVPTNETESLREAIDGYQHFMKLAEQYADEVIKQTRRERERQFPKTAGNKKGDRTKRGTKSKSEKKES